MKKLLVLSVVMSMAAAANAGMLVTKLSLDGEGAMTGSNGFATNVSPGVGIAAEYLNKVEDVKHLVFGYGAEYQFPRAVTNGGFCGFMPVYVTGQYSLCKCCHKPYVKANFGYDMVFNGDSTFKYNNTAVLSGGVYYAAGIGSHLCKNMIAELMYSVYSGTWESSRNNNTIIAADTYSVLALKVGYCFNLGECCKDGDKCDKGDKSDKMGK